MKTEVLGMNLMRHVDFTRKTAILATGDIAIPEIQTTIRGVALAVSRGELIAFPPFSNGKGGGTNWNCRGEFAMSVAGKLVEMYVRMGGKVPPKLESRPVFIPLSELVLSEDEGLPFPERVEDALEKESARRGVPVFTEVFERAAPEAGDDEAAEGLKRTLRIDAAVSETMERAGL